MVLPRRWRVVKLARFSPPMCCIGPLQRFHGVNVHVGDPFGDIPGCIGANKWAEVMANGPETPLLMRSTPKRCPLGSKYLFDLALAERSGRFSPRLCPETPRLCPGVEPEQCVEAADAPAGRPLTGVVGPCSCTALGANTSISNGSRACRVRHPIVHPCMRGGVCMCIACTSCVHVLEHAVFMVCAPVHPSCARVHRGMTRRCTWCVTLHACCGG